MASIKFPTPSNLLIFTYSDLAALRSESRDRAPSPAPPTFESERQASDWIAAVSGERAGSYAFYYRWEGGLEGFKYNKPHPANCNYCNSEGTIDATEEMNRIHANED